MRSLRCVPDQLNNDTMPDRIDLADTFDSAAPEYQRYRPGYPDSIGDRILLHAPIQRGARILEIGCGTGQATGFFKTRYPKQKCIDPGQHLMAVCREQHPD